MPHEARSLLILEEDDAVRAMLAYFITSLGHIAHPVADGREAVRLVEQHPDIRAALLSIGPDRPDGVETFQTLRKLNPLLPGIFMVGGTARYTRDQLYQVGAAHIFEKPFRFDELGQVLERISAAFRKRQPAG